MKLATFKSALYVTLCMAGVAAAGPAAPRRVAPRERWEMRDGRFYRNGQWVFIKCGKLIEPFEDPRLAGEIIAHIDIMVDRLNYNAFSLNIYPRVFDLDGDGSVDPARESAMDGVARIFDHCWTRGVFCAISFETYNVGGGGVPPALFARHPEIQARNALGEPATDLEYAGEVGMAKPVPSIFHPTYVDWARRFMAGFLHHLGRDRASRLLFVETTVEPQYLGRCNAGDRDPRRAALDFSDAARLAFAAWNERLRPDDWRRGAFQWPMDSPQRARAIGDPVFNDFRAESLAEWVNGDIRAIRSMAPDVYVAVDYNGRFDDPDNIRIGDHEAFLSALQGADILQVAPHAPEPWGTSSWNDVIRVNARLHRHWAVSEHMTANGTSPEEDGAMTRILENTLQRGTRWGWDLVKAANQRPGDAFSLYGQDWTSPVLDVVEGHHWTQWLQKIGATRFVPEPRAPIGGLP